MRSAFLDAYFAYRFVLGRPVHMLRFGLWPLIAAIVMAFAVIPLIGVAAGFLTNLPNTTGTGALVVLLVIAGLPGSWFATVFAIRWHRLVLMGEGQTSGFEAAFGEKVGRYLVWVCVLEFILGVSLVAAFVPIINLQLDMLDLSPAAGGLAAELGAAAASALLLALEGGAYALLLSLIGLVFPSIAIEQPYDLKTLWRLTEGRRLRNFLTLFLVFVVPMALWTVFSQISARPAGPAEATLVVPGGVAPAGSSAISILVEALLTYTLGAALVIALVAATAVALSNMYRPGAHAGTTKPAATDPA